MGVLVNPYILAAAGGGGPTYPLDAIKGAFRSALSFRQLFSDYAGAAMRVRRSSGGAEMDIGFVDGIFDVGTAETFRLGVGPSGQLTAIIIYDQSGNGNDATTGEALVTNSDNYALIYLAVSYAQRFSIDPAVFGSATAATGYAVMQGSYAGWAAFTDFGGPGDRAHTPYTDAHLYDGFFASDRPDVGSYSNINDDYHLHMMRNSGTSLAGYRDGVVVGPVTSSAVSLPLAHAYFPGYQSYSWREMCLLDEAVSSGDRELIEGNALWAWGREAALPSGHPYESAAP